MVDNSIFENILDHFEEHGDSVEYGNVDLLQGPELSIIDFTESKEGLNIILRPAQRAILKLFYGLPLSGEIPEEDDNTPLLESNRIIIRHPISQQVIGPFSEKGYLDYLKQTNKTNAQEGKSYTKLILNIGRRAGKSTISTIISCYELYRLLRKGSPQKHYNIRENAKIRIIVVGTDKTQSGELFDSIQSFSEQSPYLNKYLSRSNRAEVAFNTPRDFEKSKRTGRNPKPTLVITPTGCSAPGLRGPATIQAIMDEVAHMKDAKSKKASADAVFEALEPSVSTFSDGKMVMISTPNGPSGFFHDIYHAAMDSPESSMLCVQAPTWEINPGRVSDDSFLVKYKLSKASFRQEYGAEFTSSTNDFIENYEIFARNLYPVEGSYNSQAGELPARSLRKRGAKGVNYFFSADLGLKNDYTVFSVGHAEEGEDSDDRKIIVDYISVYDPKDDRWVNSNGVLSYRKMAQETARIFNNFNIVKGVFDQYQGLAYKETLEDYNLYNVYELFVTDRVHSDVYSIFRSLYMDERLELPATVELLESFHNLEVSTKGYGDNVMLKVRASYGHHDDVADSVARLVFLIYKEAFLRENVCGKKVQEIEEKANFKVVMNLKHNKGLGSKAIKNIMRKHNVVDSMISPRKRK